jgi:hypothetical protein
MIIAGVGLGDGERYKQVRLQRLESAAAGTNGIGLCYKPLCGVQCHRRQHPSRPDTIINHGEAQLPDPVPTVPDEEANIA